MSEKDPSAIAGNLIPGETVHDIWFECYEDAWRGFSADYRPRELGREVSWGEHVGVTFDPLDPGVIKSIYVDTVESGWSGGDEAIPERQMLAQLLGVDVSSFDEPAKLDPDTLTPEEKTVFYENRNNEDALFAYGEAFGRQPNVAVTIDTALARELYEEALATALAQWDQERLAAELTGVGYITGDRDESRVEVLARYIDEHPEYREGIKAAVVDAIDISNYPTSETIWPKEESKVALAALQQKLSAAE